MEGPRRGSLAAVLATVLVAVALVMIAALPVAGQDPKEPASPAPAASEKPGNGPPAEKPGNGPKADKADKVPEVAVTLTGRVGTRSDDEGETAYTLMVGGTVYDLHVGPPWWWGEDNPIAKHVGKTVTITGESAEGSTEVDVFTIDGETVREPGKPPWAGGWKVVGEKHPGWAQWKADKAAAKAEWKAQGKWQGPPPWAGPRLPTDTEGSGD